MLTSRWLAVTALLTLPWLTACAAGGAPTSGSVPANAGRAVYQSGPESLSVDAAGDWAKFDVTLTLHYVGAGIDTTAQIDVDRLARGLEHGALADFLSRVDPRLVADARAATQSAPEGESKDAALFREVTAAVLTKGPAAPGGDLRVEMALGGSGGDPHTCYVDCRDAGNTGYYCWHYCYTGW